jgi:hypothetical protein
MGRSVEQYTEIGETPAHGPVVLAAWYHRTFDFGRGDRFGTYV